MTDALLLVDKSALVRAAEPDDNYELCMCAVTRLEVLYSARDDGEYAQVGERLDHGYRHLRVDAETFSIAETAQRELASRSQHRIPIPDLLIAACAHQHGAGVLHVDRHYDALSGVLEFDSVHAGPG